MKFYENVMQRTKDRQYKLGKSYPQKDGKLYKTLKVFYILAMAFGLVMNLMYVTGILLFIDEPRIASQAHIAIIVSILSVLLIAALVISKYNDNLIIAAVFGGVNFGCALTIILFFKNILLDDTVVGGLNIDFYWRHLAPNVIMALCALGMVAVVVSAYFKTKKAYNKTLEIVYEAYNSIPTDERPDWEEYVSNYQF